MLRDAVARGFGPANDLNNYRPDRLDSAALKASANNIYEKLQQLTPANETQRALHAEAMQIGAELGHTRALLLEQTGGSIPIPFLVVLVFWLVMIFVGFGLFAPANPTVVSVLLVCALSAAGAIFLIVELDRPFEGLIRISDAPLRDALSRLQQAP